VGFEGQPHQGREVILERLRQNKTHGIPPRISQLLKANRVPVVGTERIAVLGAFLTVLAIREALRSHRIGKGLIKPDFDFSNVHPPLRKTALVPKRTHCER
jgi:hypothetical protein